MQEMQVWSLGREDPLEKDMAAHSNFAVILQYSCPGNPTHMGAWWATVHGVANSGHNWATEQHYYAQSQCQHYTISSKT